MKKKIFLVIAIILIIGIIGGGIIVAIKIDQDNKNKAIFDKKFNANNEKEKMMKTVNENYSNSITEEKFNNIKTGMSYSEVCEIIGFSGKLSTEYASTKIYVWQDSSNNIISISFVNNKVTSKTQV